MKGYFGRAVRELLAIYLLVLASAPIPATAVPVTTPALPVPVPAPAMPLPHVPLTPGPTPPHSGFVSSPSGQVPVPAPAPASGHISAPHLLGGTQLLTNADLPVVVVDGSRSTESRKKLPNQCFNEMNRAGVKCCSYDNEQCVSPCREENEILPFELATLLCIDIGMHMCSHEELTELASCEHNGCAYEGEYVWTSSSCSGSISSKKHPRALSLRKSSTVSTPKMPALRRPGKYADADELDSVSKNNHSATMAETRNLRAKKGPNSFAPSLGVVTYGCPRTHSSHAAKYQQAASAEVEHFNVETGVAGVRCCSFDGMMCTSACRSLKEMLPRAEAKTRCADMGARLCSRTELASSICCESQCGYDSEYVWTNQLTE